MHLNHLNLSEIPFQSIEELRQTPNILQTTDRQVAHTQSYCNNDVGLYESKFMNHNRAIDTALLQSEEPLSWHVNMPFHLDLLDTGCIATSFPWSGDTDVPLVPDDRRSSKCSERFEDNRSEIADVLNTSLFKEGTLGVFPPWIAVAGQLFRSSSDTTTRDEALYSGITVDDLCEMLDFSDLVQFEPDIPLVTSEAQDLEALTSPESQRSEIPSSPVPFLEDATKDIKRINLTEDGPDGETTNPEPIGHSSSDESIVCQRTIIDLTEEDSDDESMDTEPISHSSSDGSIECQRMVIDLTQDDDKEKIATWNNEIFDDIDYNYRSSYENRQYFIASARDFPYSRTNSNFVTTALIVNGKSYQWNHRCKEYKSGNSCARPRHKDTTIVMRAGGSNIPIELTYRGFSI
ncbi:hypothetical protein VFPPC_18354 [Pochonia chlamydosporia 170]|uniref:Uncharacterized protein n=1 Tax=Pochonia chlamydosporia 170 TaxID=1380566 RepID=A0A219ASW4_METCM|nr:hypothetical protein VFPPC_18354 [Pochonia chlamydosporia 170]OWT43394.1 hypothetical protein VFPPC_18354 [Pochonia chlamydosporia 170]